MRLIYRGAEAELYKDDFAGIPVVRKRRIPKRYRNSVLDDRIRTTRIRQESRLLSEARRALRTPYVLDIDLGESKKEITMEYINGTRIKELFTNGNVGKSEEIGERVRKLHDSGMVHGDLTTSNMILRDDEVIFIDFGLGFFSGELEDKATDLVVFKKMLQSTHYEYFDGIWKLFLKGYKPGKAMLEKIEEIEKRVRYK
jgi:N6-L-threonylcarbamoyladenine synthase/protein kinase Bud32